MVLNFRHAIVKIIAEENLKTEKREALFHPL